MFRAGLAVMFLKTRDKFLFVFKGTPYGRARRHARSGFQQGRELPGKASEQAGNPPPRQGRRGTRRWQAAAWPAASSAAAHRRGPLPPPGQARTRPLVVLAVTPPGDRACKD